MERTILVVDDFKTIRAFIYELLQSKGYKTIAASNGKEAFDVISDKDLAIDLVLTDYNMPNINGVDILKQVRKRPLRKSVPVVFLTTEDDPLKIAKAKTFGLTDWILKPYKKEEFFAKLEMNFGYSSE